MPVMPSNVRLCGVQLVFRAHIYTHIVIFKHTFTHIMTVQNRQSGNYAAVDDATTESAIQEVLDARITTGVAPMSATDMADACNLPADKATLQSIGRVLDSMGFKRARHAGRRVFLITAQAPAQAQSLQGQVDALREENTAIRAQMADMAAMLADLMRDRRAARTDAMADIKAAIDPLLPTLSGRHGAAYLADISGLDSKDHATLVRIGKYLNSLGIKRGRNTLERYYWFPRQNNLSVISSHDPVIDPFG
jgi:hypothetical protein